MSDKVISMEDFRATEQALEDGEPTPERIPLAVDTNALAYAAGQLYRFLSGCEMTPQELAKMYAGLFIELEPVKEFLLNLGGKKDA